MIIPDKISNELEHERAFVLYNKCTDKSDKKRLKQLIIDYENLRWSGEISDELVIESDLAEIKVEKERIRRKSLLNLLGDI